MTTDKQTILKLIRLNSEDGLTQREVEQASGFYKAKTRSILAELKGEGKIIYVQKGRCKIWRIKK